MMQHLTDEDRHFWAVEAASWAIIVLGSLLIVWLLIGSYGVFAHSLDCKGRPVPESIKFNCCGKADHYLIDATMVHEHADGSWTVDVEGQTINVPAERALPSNDGCWHIFFDKRRPEFPYCLFIVPGV